MRVARWLLFGSALLAATPPAHAQQLTGGGGVEISLLRIIFALVVSIIAALGLILVLRGRGANLPTWLRHFAVLSAHKRIEVLETRRIASLAELSLVRCDGAEYLILTGPGGSQVLERREAQIDAGGHP